MDDHIVIKRLEASPERRVFYVDIGNMPIEAAKRAIDALKAKLGKRS